MTDNWVYKFAIFKDVWIIKVDILFGLVPITILSQFKGLSHLNFTPFKINQTISVFNNI